MKMAIIVLVLMGAAYYLFNHETPLHLAESGPYYIEVRMDSGQGGLQLVGVVKLNSQDECEDGASASLEQIIDDIHHVSARAECMRELPEKFKKLFANEEATATYIAFDSGPEDGIDARFLFYGIPSSASYQKCEEMTKKVTKKHAGKVYCVQGSIG
jgi:hypothetical protein